MAQYRNLFYGSLLGVMTAFAAPAEAQGIGNPVLRGVADAGVMKWAGKYYIGGVSTYGDFHVSTDLVNWSDRVHAFDLDNAWTHGTGAKNNQIHADDISFSNGLFHLLFSVNYWGSDRHIVHIAHATSPSVTGPYTETRQDQWFENRIDPQVFRDEDGKLYLYMVKFTDGNTIWARPMNPDFSFAGEAVQQFSSQPGTWETLDNRVAEGPFVVKYRGIYYMMYNTNHTAPQYGNYRLGVCEAASPLGFNPGGKYPHPVVAPETDRLDDNCEDLIVYGSGGYRPVDLSKDTIRFRLDALPKSHPCLKIAQRGGCEITLNGHTLNAGSQSEYRLLPVNRSLVRKGENIITVRRASEKSRLFALALYDMDEERSGDLLLTPGQPNIVRGPNGWEWWLVYMANKGWTRDQYIDRIHFSGNRLRVDGITDSRTAGFHPAPALPQHCGKSLDGAEISDAYLLEATFLPQSDRQSVVVAGREYALPGTMSASQTHVWRVERNHSLLNIWIDGVAAWQGEAIDAADLSLKVNGDVEYLSYNDGWDEHSRLFSGWENAAVTDNGLSLSARPSFKGKAANGYEFSVMFDNATPGRGRYGVYAAWQDSKNYVKATIDAAARKLIVENRSKGKSAITESPLARTETHYPDVKYTDTYEKQYRFDCDTYVSGILLPRLDADNDPYASALDIEEKGRRSFRDDMAATQQIDWLDGDTWRRLDYQTADSPLTSWQHITFPAVRTRALRFINADPEDNSRNIYRIKTTRDFAAACQLRVERRGSDLHIFVDDRETASLTLRDNAPSRVGLHSDGGAEVAVRNTLYYVVKQ